MKAIKIIVVLFEYQVEATPEVISLLSVKCYVDIVNWGKSCYMPNGMT